MAVTLQNDVLASRGAPNKALQATTVNVAKMRAILVRVSRSKPVLASWGAPELNRWAAS